MAETQRKTKGTADIIDKHVGKQLRHRRTLLGISQEKLADAIGVTFQQVQKYERGTNRISASRLYSFSKILDVSIDFFYHDLEDTAMSEAAVPYGMSDNDQEDFQGLNAKAKKMPEDLMSNKETISLLRAYYSVTDDKDRRDILRLVKTMAKKMSSDS